MASDHQRQNEKDQENQESSEFQKTCQRYNDLLPALPKTERWWIDLCQYQGFWLASPPTLKGVMFIQDHFRSKPQDIILATSPKCGTNWSAALIFATINRKAYSFTSHTLLTKSPLELFTPLELAFCQSESIFALEALPSPRRLSTHVPYTLLPESVKASGCRFVHMCRNPKDAFVSLWHFSIKVTSGERPTLSMEDAFELFCEGVSPYGPFWDHVLSYWKASQEAPDKVLFLTYEDVQKEPEEQVKRLAKFLGVPFSAEEEREGVVQQIVKLCCFENLSNLEVNKSTVTKLFAKNSDFFRKGEVGDWRNHLTPEMAARLDRITKEKLNGSTLTFPLSNGVE